MVPVVARPNLEAVDDDHAMVDVDIRAA